MKNLVHVFDHNSSISWAMSLRHIGVSVRDVVYRGVSLHSEVWFMVGEVLLEHFRKDGTDEIVFTG